MRLTFGYQLEDGTTGEVTTRASDAARVERKTGDMLTKGLGFTHCAMMVHSVLTREAKRDGTKAVTPFELWLENELVDVEHRDKPTADQEVNEEEPFEEGGSISQ